MSARVWHSKPTEALPWRVTLRKGALVEVHRFRTETEARDFASRVMEYN